MFAWIVEFQRFNVPSYQLIFPYDNDCSIFLLKHFFPFFIVPNLRFVKEVNICEINEFESIEPVSCTLEFLIQLLTTELFKGTENNMVLMLASKGLQLFVILDFGYFTFVIQLTHILDKLQVIKSTVILI